MRTLYSQQTPTKIVIVEETEEGKIKIKSIKGDVIRQYVSFADIDNFDFLLEVMKKFREKYTVEHPPETNDPLRRIDLE